MGEFKNQFVKRRVRELVFFEIKGYYIKEFFVAIKLNGKLFNKYKGQISKMITMEIDRLLRQISLGDNSAFEQLYIKTKKTQVKNLPFSFKFLIYHKLIFIYHNNLFCYFNDLFF